TVYLRGLIGVHTFFRRSLQQDRLRLCRRLFAGKMTLEDVTMFEPMFDAGVLVPPRWLPSWVSRANGLAGMLAFSLFANRIRLDRLSDDT
ncbi:MAG TPA: tyrosine/phenylalanine carboxypeptidase domain-containing protein, partial [Pseudoxanthomonas sp.]|nr:tyrosine/phenylalanine carboxypeptidase domain-containing protein [Pseudoxanthomonas sp.]